MPCPFIGEYKIVLLSKNGNLLKVTMAFVFDAFQSSGGLFGINIWAKKDYAFADKLAIKYMQHKV